MHRNASSFRESPSTRIPAGSVEDLYKTIRSDILESGDTRQNRVSQPWRQLPVEIHRSVNSTKKHLYVVTSIHLHAFWSKSRANGPGLRAVAWLQGCTLGCPGCFNPETHSKDGASRVTVESLASRLLQLGTSVEGLTLTGGEPLEQALAVKELLEELRAHSQLSVLIFSGYKIEEIRNLDHGPEILSLIDVLVDGRYVESQHLARGLRGSHNQRIHLLSSRYCLAEIERTPMSEVSIAANGEVRVTGVEPLRVPGAADHQTRNA